MEHLTAMLARPKKGNRRTQTRATPQARSSALTSSSRDSPTAGRFPLSRSASSAAIVDMGLGAAANPIRPTTSSTPRMAASAASTSATPCSTAGKSNVRSSCPASEHHSVSLPAWLTHSSPLKMRHTAAALTAGTEIVLGACSSWVYAGVGLKSNGRGCDAALAVSEKAKSGRLGIVEAGLPNALSSMGSTRGGEKR